MRTPSRVRVLQSLRELAERVGRDHSVVTRALKRIFDRFPVVEKKAGKWILTDLGRKINDLTKASLHSQTAVLNSRAVLRIGTNREFASRVLAADFKQIQAMFPNTQIVLNSYELGTESALLLGQIDIGVDCDRPFDPEVSYRLVTDEPIFAVASKAFIKALRREIAAGQLARLDEKIFGKSRYGIWWLRSRTYLKDACEKVSLWLQEKAL